MYEFIQILLGLLLACNATEKKIRVSYHHVPARQNAAGTIKQAGQWATSGRLPRIVNAHKIGANKMHPATRKKTKIKKRKS
jgi:hypothetical protein